MANHAKRRETAERRRLLYVAVTRAARQLVFVGGLVQKKPDDPLLPKGEIAEWLDQLSVPRRRAPDVAPPAEPAPKPVWIAAERMQPVRSPRRLRVTPTAVQDFVLCPRRYVMAHVLALPEERPAFARQRTTEGVKVAEGALAPREEGTRMHRLLETVDASAFGGVDARERLVARAMPEEVALVDQLLPVLQSPYAQSIPAGGGRLDRELAFSLRRDFAAGSVLIVGSIDLVVHWPNGTADVLDYKRSALHSIERYRTQVALYRQALLAAQPAAEVRAGLWSLLGDAPHFFTTDETAHATAEIDEALPRFIETAPSPDTERQPEPYCQRIRCGFRPRCHSS